MDWIILIIQNGKCKTKTNKNLNKATFVCNFYFLFIFYVWNFPSYLFRIYRCSKRNFEDSKEKEDLEHKINQFQKDIDALKDEELIEGVLRKNGYGRAGEIIYIYDNPEPVKPIDEIFNTDKKVSFPEAIINFISGNDG